MKIRCENLTERIKFRLAFTANPHAERSKRKLDLDGLTIKYGSLGPQIVRREDASQPEGQAYRQDAGE